MQPFSIKYHPPGASAPPAAFFILSRGRHPGRPAYTPNPNCFVFTCAPQDLHRYYWLVYALWLSRRFEPLLCGSVIEFIHIGDLKMLIATSARNMEPIDKAVETLQKFLLLEKKMQKQLALIQTGRRMLLQAV
jgi:hypothetical protein